MATLEFLLAFSAGLGLAAACGFRIFVPFFVAAIGKQSGLPLLDGLPTWLGSLPALIVLGTASVVEVAAYYVPWFDNLLDSVASPAAVLAGVLVFAGVHSELEPVWRWSLAAIAGGGAAGLAQSTTVLTRATSLGTTGGLANPLVSTVELIAAGLTSTLAIVLPPLTLLVLGLVVWKLVGLLRRYRTRQNARP